ncbi:MAG: DNA polymerase III subunit beta [Clostridia bacterium]|nr:DNA polymerase III subunit beta [Clostridia bacterium]
MHFQVEKTPLLTGINLVEKAISANNPLQILAGIEIIANKDHLVVTTNNLEIAIRTTIQCNTMKTGKAIVDGKLLTSLVRKLPDDNVVFEMKDKQVIISAGTMEFALNIITGDDFPAFPECNQKILALTDYELHRLAHCSLFAAANDDKRPVLSGVLLEITDGKLNFVATDSNRLSFVQAQTGEIVSSDLRLILPNKSLNELMKCLPLNETMVEVFYGNNQLAFKFNETTFTTRLIEGNFPNYQPVLHTEQQITVIIKRHQLLQAIDRAALFDRGGTQPVIVQVTDGVLEIGISTELGKSSEQFNVEHEGENGTSAYSPKYILDMLRTTDSDQIVFKFETGPRQALIKPADRDDHLYILMPVRI